jgi:N-acetylglucosamine kinase-like BadF-type ATPase
MKSPSKNPVGVGIDIGGTKTHLRIDGPSGMRRDFVLPTADWRVRQWDDDAVALLAIAHKFAAGAPIAAIAVGAHGCDDQSECDAFQAALTVRATFPVQVVNDAELLPAALGLSHEIGLVAGTGSIAVNRTRKGRMLVAGGWGWVIGDEGSAPGLVREAARTVARYLENGCDPHEPLVRGLFAALDIHSSAQIGGGIARCGSARALGRHAPMIFEAAEAGSQLAHEVIRDGARHLAALIGRLQRQGAEAKIVVAGGGVIAAQRLLWTAFAEEVAIVFAGRIAARLFTGAPVEGACRLAAALTPAPSCRFAAERCFE